MNQGLKLHSKKREFFIFSGKTLNLENIFLIIENKID